MMRYITFVVIITLLFTFQVTSPSGNSNDMSMEKSADVDGGASSFEKEVPNTKKKKSHWVGTALLVTLGVATVATMLYFTVIKKPEYKLTVTADEGVTGSPEAGTYKYKKGTQVDYAFSPQPGYKQLTVLLDGSPISASGKINMDRDHTLAVSALEKGNYLTITLQIRYILKAMNTGGGANLYFNKKKYLSKSFYTTKIGDVNSTCTDGDLLIDETQTWTIDTPSLYSSQLYYHGCVNKSYPFFICPEFQITVASYTWEAGKADPGSPIIKNPQDIVFDKSKMCLTLPGGDINCECLVTLEFISPPDPARAQKVLR